MGAENINTPSLQHSITPLLSDYHSHPQGHRVQRYSQKLLQPWADHARKFGLRDIAFTDHDRYHEGIDFDELDRLRQNNPDLKIRAGIELDNDPVSSEDGRKWVEHHWDQLDFVLGSVHYLEQADMFDRVPEGAVQFEGREIDSIYEDYFRRVREVAGTGLVDCLSHLDLIKIHGHRPNRAMADLVNETLDFIRSRDLAIELSTAGWRKPVNELYPSDEIIRLAMEKGIPFTIASDAHSYAQLGENYPRLAEKMAALGINKVCVYERHQRSVVPLVR
ncbi:MAG TPA: histidinol-phosphatase HisJ family protein [Chthoniobacterales bacterium]|nr:histidinol-phosphatase HisJ family protein [Chthoniobacterales bacterium]